MAEVGHLELIFISCPYLSLIGPSVEYKDKEDSRVLKTFLVQTLTGVNHYVFSKDDKRLMLPHEKITQMSFWLKFNTGELIAPGYPITLDLRIEQKKISLKYESRQWLKINHPSDTRILQGLAVQR